jgi:hypothetical protein
MRKWEKRKRLRAHSKDVREQITEDRQQRKEGERLGRSEGEKKIQTEV